MKQSLFWVFNKSIKVWTFIDIYFRFRLHTDPIRINAKKVISFAYELGSYLGSCGYFKK